MKYSRISGVLIGGGLLMSAAFGFGRAGAEAPDQNSSSAFKPPQVISFVELLVNRKKYIGKRVQIMGFIVRSDYIEGLAVYLDRDHALLADLTTEIGILNTSQKCTSALPQEMQSYGLVKGTICVGGPGGVGLCDVDSIYVVNIDSYPPDSQRLCTP